MPSHLGLRSYESVVIETQEDYKLSGYYIPGELDTGLVLIHGIGGCKEEMLKRAAFAHRLGFHTMVFDLRAQGRSEGSYCTFGYLEKYDIIKSIDLMLEKCVNCTVGIWGKSLGGAIALQTLEHDDRLSFGIVESTFTELDNVVHGYMQRYLGGRSPKWISDVALYFAGIYGRFKPDGVKPIHSVTQITKPIFYIHGSEDVNIAPPETKKLYEKGKHKKNQYYLVDGAAHADVPQIGGEEYWNRIKAFILDNEKIE